MSVAAWHGLSVAPGALRCVFLLALAASGCGSRAAVDPPGGPSVSELVSQLQGKGCRYSPYAHEVCKVRESALETLPLYRHPERECVAGAARCLGRLGGAAREAVPALIGVLLHGPNDYDTGDGVIPVRSAVASALGAAGDPRAIEPLAKALREGAPMDRADTALPPNGEPAARVAIVEALGSFGPSAAAHALELAALLRAQNRAGLSGSSLASAMARALGSFRDPSAAAVLLETLTNRGARPDALRALAQLSPPPVQAVPALTAILVDSESQALAAAALAAIGPAADPALPRLMEIVRLPSLVRMEGRSLYYPAEAYVRMTARQAAAAAVISIRPGEAQRLLAPFAADPDLKNYLIRRLIAAR